MAKTMRYLTTKALLSILIFEKYSYGAPARTSTSTRRKHLHEIAKKQKHRVLEWTLLGSVTDSFVPLPCNDPLATLDLTSCIKYSQITDTYVAGGKFTVPCGVCVEMDVTDGSMLDFPSTIHVIGKLYFGPTTKATIETSAIIVEGELHMETMSSSAITGEPNIKIVLKGETDVLFTPTGVNAAKCGGTACNLGSKPIVVLGGKLNINGMDDTCPSWDYMQDVEELDVPTPTANDVYPKPMDYAAMGNDCSSVVMNDTFGDGPLATTGWTGGLGARASLEAGQGFEGTTSLKVTNRHKSWQGPTKDLLKHLHCMAPDSTVFITAKIKFDLDGVLSEEGKTQTRCAENGQQCGRLKLTYMNGLDQTRYVTLISVDPTNYPGDGQWFDVYGQAILDNKILDPANVYSIITFEGPERGVDISVDNIKIEYPPTTSYPSSASQVCTNLAYNGNAESQEFFPYPFMARWGSTGSLKVAKDPSNESNNIFKMVGRTATQHNLQFHLTKACLQSGSRYHFKSRIWLHSDVADTPRVFLQILNEDQAAAFEPIVICPETSESLGWVTCEGYVTFADHHILADDVYVLFLMTSDETSDTDYDDLSLTFLSGGAGLPIFGTEASQCWGEGSELLMASPTTKFDNTKELKIEKSYISEDGNHVMELTSADGKSNSGAVAKAQNDVYATEFALLSRRIVFEALNDSNDPTKGASLHIHSTPNVAQMLKGVAIEGFGQQGAEGKFPIYLHSSNGSNIQIERNIISNSHHRGIVLKDTSNVLIKHNVVYKSYGHSYVIDQGSNSTTVESNLGLHTLKATEIITGETDQNPATYLIQNPSNTFIGNIAGGSSDTGFFINVEESADPHGGVTLFRNNVAHSNAYYGIKTWPTGYSPEQAAVLENTNVYRNAKTGIFFHAGKHLHIQGGHIADNQIGIDINFHDDITIDGNVTIVGQSDNYKVGVQEYGYISLCGTGASKAHLYGIRVHANAKDDTLPGTSLDQVHFEGFSTATAATDNCDGTAIGINGIVRETSFDTSLTLNALTFDADSTSKIAICDVVNAGVTDVMIQDLNGALNPSVNSTSTSGLIMNVGTATLGPPCTVLEEDTCAQYCDGACMQKVTVVTTSQGTDTIELVIEDSEQQTLIIEGSFVSGTLYEDTFWTQRRYYSAALPASSTYQATFKDKSNGEAIWPTFAKVMLGDEPSCGTLSNFTLIKPPKTDTCDSIDASDFNTGDVLSSGWHHMGGGIKYVTPGYGTEGGNALATNGRTVWSHGLALYLDTRCMVEVDTTYNIEMKMKLTFTNGVNTDCDAMATFGNNVCPRGSIKAIKDGSNTTYVDWGVAALGGPVVAGEWSTFFGSFTVTQEIVNADEVLLMIERLHPGKEIVIDNVQITKAQEGATQNFIKNPNFETGTYSMWQFISSTNFKMVQPGNGTSSNYALSTDQRPTSWIQGPSQDLDPTLFDVGSEYVVEMDVKLEFLTGAPSDCNPFHMYLRGDGCPVAAVLVVKATGNEVVHLAATAGPMKTDGSWNRIRGIFRAPPSFAEATKLKFVVGAGSIGKNIVIDNVVVRPASVETDDVVVCDEASPSNLIRNNDLEVGDARYWVVFGGGMIALTNNDGAQGSSTAIRHYNRGQLFWGPAQYLDTSCFNEGGFYDVTAYFKMKTSNGLSYGCDRSAAWGDTMCPLITIYSLDPVTKDNEFVRVFADVAELPAWNQDSWNLYKGSFQISSKMKTYPTVMAYVEKVRAGIEVYVDQLVIKKRVA